MVPVARKQPRGVAEHAEVALWRSRDRAKQLTTNRVTRSWWFVTCLGALPILVPMILIGFLLLFAGPYGK
jgi:hypothetical protein